MPGYKTFRTKQIGPVTTVTPLETELLSANSFNELTDELLDFVKTERPRMVLLCLEKVTRYSSEAIGGLIRVRDKVAAGNGEVKLCVNKDLRKLFKLTNLDGTLFEIHETVNEGVAAFFD